MSRTVPRRTVLAASGALPLAAACAASPVQEGDRVPGTASTAAPTDAAPTDFVLVHGAWHGSAHWAPVAAELVARGHRALAVDLPGHGVVARFPRAYLTGDAAGLSTEPSPIADVTLDVAADAVVEALRGLREGRRIVLVAHSMGGAVATAAVERAPELVDHLVYVTAFVPTKLGSAFAYLSLPEAKTALGGGLYLGDPAAIGAVRINPRSTDPTYLEELRAAYYTDVTTEAFLPFALALTPDQPVSFLATEVGATAERWGSVPRTYVRCTEDRALPIALQDVLIRDADELTPANRFRQVTLPTGHSPFASRPAELAAVLAEVDR